MIENKALALSAEGIGDIAGNADFRSRVYSVTDLVDMLNDGHLVFAPGQPWGLPGNTQLRQHFVESLLMGLPPSAVLIDGSREPWVLIDGADCLKAYSDFYKGAIDVHLFFNPADSDTPYSFGTLPLKFRSRFMNTVVTATVLNPGTPYLSRVWAFYTALSKTASRKSLWSLLPVLNPAAERDLKNYAARYGFKDGHNLLRCLTGLMLNDERPETNIIPLLDTPYEVFEISCLGSEKSPVDFDRIALPGSLAALFKELENILPHRRTILSDKKLTCLIWVIIKLCLQRGSAKENIYPLFEKAWMNYIRHYNGDSVRAYMRLSDLIYRDINDKAN